MQGIELHGSWWTSSALGSGNSLAHYMYREGRFSETKAKYVFGQIVEAVYYLDSIGISHGDIKPLNALIDTELKVCYGRPISIDFVDLPHPMVR